MYQPAHPFGNRPLASYFALHRNRLRIWVQKLVRNFLDAAQAIQLSLNLSRRPYLGKYFERHKHQYSYAVGAFDVDRLGTLGRSILFCFPHQKKDFKKDIVPALIVSLGIMIIITLYFKGISFYYILTKLPGVSAFRAVTRIILIMLIPFSIITALFISSLIEKAKRWDRPLLRVFFVSCVFVFFLAENQNAPHRFSKKMAQRRVSVLIKKISVGHINHNSVLAYIHPPTRTWWVPSLDAMLAAQKLNISTLNGYSAKFPNGMLPLDSCYALNLVVSHYLRYYPQLSDQLHKLKNSLIVVNPGQPCTPDFLFSVSTIDHPLPAKAYKAAIWVKPGSMEANPGENFRIKVYVKNDSKFYGRQQACRRGNLRSVSLTGGLTPQQPANYRF